MENVLIEIETLKNPQKAVELSKFFKTDKGEYGYGDIFMGIPVPSLRNIVKKYLLDLNEIQILLSSKEHEKRVIALFFLLKLYQKTKDKKDKQSIINFYLKNTKYINNWDLVDITCYKILGDFLLKYNNQNYDILLKLSKSKNLWERRISIVSTMIFVKNNFFEPTLTISKKLLKNEHDLINKAVGWLLREVGKRDKELLKNFLTSNIKDISKTTLNYAMEKFSKEEKIVIKNTFFS